MTDIGASVIARLRNKAKTSGKPFLVHLQLFCQEEFLRKISLSKYADNLVLKGGMFLYTLTGFESRATLDVDFLLRYLPSSVEDVQRVVKEILSVDTGNDFISFEVNGFEPITPQRKYQGVSFRLIGKIKNTKTPFHVDFGVGDVIVPHSEKRAIPTQLENFTVPEVAAYSLESTVAEKFDAMLQRLELTSRMKDYYDIYYIAVTFDFDGRKLQEAIKQTLQIRGTDYYQDSFDLLMSLSHNEIMHHKWILFLRKTGQQGPSFDTVMKTIDLFLRPAFQAILDGNEWLEKWKCCGSWE